MLSSSIYDSSIKYDLMHLSDLTIGGLKYTFMQLFTASEYGCGRHGGLMVSTLDSGASAPGSSPGRGHCVVFLGKTLYSHGASLHPGV